MTSRFVESVKSEKCGGRNDRRVAGVAKREKAKN